MCTLTGVENHMVFLKQSRSHPRTCWCAGHFSRTQQEFRFKLQSVSVILCFCMNNESEMKLWGSCLDKVICMSGCFLLIFIKMKRSEKVILIETTANSSKYVKQIEKILPKFQMQFENENISFFKHILFQKKKKERKPALRNSTEFKDRYSYSRHVVYVLSLK